MERKTPQKILLWNDCHVSYIWFKERIFLFFPSQTENQDLKYSKTRETSGFLAFI